MVSKGHLKDRMDVGFYIRSYCGRYSKLTGACIDINIRILPSWFQGQKPFFEGFLCFCGLFALVTGWEGKTMEEALEGFFDGLHKSGDLS